MEITFSKKVSNPDARIFYNHQTAKWQITIDNAPEIVVDATSALMTELKKAFEAKGIMVDLEK